MKVINRVLFSVLACLMFSLPSHADVDLYSPLPQSLPEAVSDDIYRALWNRGLEQCDEPGKCVIDLKNFYCEISQANTASPQYKCSYGLNDEFTGYYAHQIYDALVQAGFISDCDDHDGTCDIDPMRSLSCEKHVDWCSGITHTCSITI